MQINRNALNRELDEALEMTFPASDPVAMSAPGSMSREPETKGETKPERDESAGQPAKPDDSASPRRKG